MFSFQEAIVDSHQFSKRHLLIGNGFSIALRPDIFHYGSLFSRANFSGHPNLPKVFAALGTQDFEVAIRNLEAGSKLAPIYVGHLPGVTRAMVTDAEALKNILVETIAGNHPDFPGSVAASKFWACRTFLRYFLGTGTMGRSSPSIMTSFCTGP